MGLFIMTACWIWWWRRNTPSAQCNYDSSVLFSWEENRWKGHAACCFAGKITQTWQCRTALCRSVLKKLTTGFSTWMSFCTTSGVCLCGHMGGIMELLRNWCVGYSFVVYYVSVCVRCVWVCRYVRGRFIIPVSVCICGQDWQGQWWGVQMESKRVRTDPCGQSSASEVHACKLQGTECTAITHAHMLHYVTLWPQNNKLY